MTEKTTDKSTQNPTDITNMSTQWMEMWTENSKAAAEYWANVVPGLSSPFSNPLEAVAANGGWYE